MNTNKYIDIPFKSGGRSWSGVDCWGLVKLIYKEEYNIELPGYDDCYENTKDENISSLIEGEKNIDWQLVDNEREGDVIVININGIPIHLGVIVGKGLMIHVKDGVGVVVENYMSYKYIRRTRGIYRYGKNTNQYLSASG